MKVLLGWAARDADGEIYIHPVKPKKFMLAWHTFEDYGIGFMRLPDDCLPEVKWSDKEPTKVKLVIDK